MTHPALMPPQCAVRIQPTPGPRCRRVGLRSLQWTRGLTAAGTSLVTESDGPEWLVNWLWRLYAVAAPVRLRITAPDYVTIVERATVEGLLLSAPSYSVPIFTARFQAETAPRTTMTPRRA